jgi:hypothetical protein
MTGKAPQSRTLSLLVMTYGAVIATPTYAWEKQWNEAPAVEDSCSTYDARYSEAPLFRISGKSKDERVYFFSKKIFCDGGDSTCPARMKAYLVDGDVVFAGPEDKNFRCVYYGTRKGAIIPGFISADHLVPYPEDDEVTQDFLVGTWTYEGNRKIVIAAAGKNKVRASGEAGWPGLGEQARHTGSFKAVASVVAGKEITLREGPNQYDCRVDLLRRGPYLVATDNTYCGGLNVRFSGILMKVRGGK